MTEKEKDLLIKDLCARLNTNLVCSIYRVDDQGIGYRDEILHGYCKIDAWHEFYFGEDCGISIDNVSKIKPYLFPLSSMTKEQKQYLKNRFCYDWDGEPYDLWKCQIEIGDTDELIDWFNKNYFDYRGLIEKGLAIDATNLNIY